MTLGGYESFVPKKRGVAKVSHQKKGQVSHSMEPKKDRNREMVKRF
jgi:hypothetical protein